MRDSALKLFRRDALVNENAGRRRAHARQRFETCLSLSKPISTMTVSEKSSCATAL